jgi:hypothetical protein
MPLRLATANGGSTFAPFTELSSEEDLWGAWRVFTKSKQFIVEGNRAENLSWRLWHLHSNEVEKGTMSEAEFKAFNVTKTQKLDLDPKVETLRENTTPVSGSGRNQSVLLGSAGVVQAEKIQAARPPILAAPKPVVAKSVAPRPVVAKAVAPRSTIPSAPLFSEHALFETTTNNFTDDLTNQPSHEWLGPDAITAWADLLGQSTSPNPLSLSDFASGRPASAGSRKELDAFYIAADPIDIPNRSPAPMPAVLRPGKQPPNVVTGTGFVPMPGLGMPSTGHEVRFLMFHSA